MSSLANLGNISNLMTDDKSNISSIPLENIKPDPSQPRKDFDQEKLQELADSIKQNGLLQPISVRQDEETDGYIINCGERRYQASLLVGKTEILAVINNDFQKIGQLIENVTREDLGLLERAYFISDLVSQGMSQKELAKQLGHKNTTWVSRHVTVAKAPEFIIDAINAGQIDNLEVAQTLTSKSKKGKWKRLIEEFLQDLPDGEKVTTTMLRSFVAECSKYLEEKEGKVASDDNQKSDKPNFDFKTYFEKLVSIDSVMMPTVNKVATNKTVINAIEQMTPKVRKALFSMFLELGDDFTTEEWLNEWEQLSSEIE